MRSSAMSDFINKISQENSEFMRLFGKSKTMRKVHEKELKKYFELYSDADKLWGYNFHLSFRKVFEGAGFIVEPTYPNDMYPYYYIVKSPFEKVKTKSTPELHLIFRAFLIIFLKISRDQTCLNKFIDELSQNLKIHEVDTYRLKFCVEIYLKYKELRLSNLYHVIANNIVSKEVRKKLPLTLINTLKDEKGCLDKKLFKKALFFFEQLGIGEAPEHLCDLDFIVTDKKKKFIYTGETFTLDSLTPYNPHLDKKGNLKIDKKIVQSLKKDTKKAQKVLKKHIAVDDLEVKTKVSESLLKQEKTRSNTMLHIKHLIKKTQWSHKDIKIYARNNGYMKMKFILEVNEYCDENFGDFLLLENENNYTINEYILGDMNDSK